jgi:hypothetical protein
MKQMKFMVVVLCMVSVLAVYRGFFDHFFHRLLGLKRKGVPEIQYSLDLCDSNRKVLYGIFTVVSKTVTRNVIRNRNKLCQFNNDMHKTIFVVGQPSTLEEHDLLREELRLHSDIFVLSCDENMNEGKSFVYFKEIINSFPCFQYYAKVDDDTAFAPFQLTSMLPDNSYNQSLFVGRSSDNHDKYWFFYLIKCIRSYFRDSSWIYDIDKYHAGMLYVLSRRAVELWVDLKPRDVYGDEDFRTSYYMGKIGAQFINVGSAFHDYQRFEPLPLRENWKKPITNKSLAVHKCKTYADYSDAFDELCTFYA